MAAYDFSGFVPYHLFPSDNHLGAAVVQIEIPGPAVGVIRMVQATEKQCIIEGTIDGLTPGKHGLTVHDFGDLSRACER